MFGFVKQVLIALFTWSGSLDKTFMSLNDEPYVARPNLIY